MRVGGRTRTDAPRRGARATSQYDGPMLQRLADTAFWLLVSLWLALALAGGIAAAAIFPASRELALSLEGYQGFIAANPEQGRMLVAGHLAERVFQLTDGARLALAPMTALALLCQLAFNPRAPHQKKRLLAVAVAAAALLTASFWSQPAFSAKDAAYREAARSGRMDEAAALKVEVDAAHTVASRVASTEAIALLALIAMSAWSVGQITVTGGGGWRKSRG